MDAWKILCAQISLFLCDLLSEVNGNNGINYMKFSILYIEMFKWFYWRNAKNVILKYKKDNDLENAFLHYLKQWESKKLENCAVHKVLLKSKVLLKILCISNYYMIKIHPEATSDGVMLWTYWWQELTFRVQ